MKPKLFLLEMPFEDSNGNQWFCRHCALLEGALVVNAHWLESVEVRRIPNQKPRQALIDILGEENQWLPVLILEDGSTMKDPVDITQYLATKFGGAAPHP